MLLLIEQGLDGGNRVLEVGNLPQRPIRRKHRKIRCLEDKRALGGFETVEQGCEI
ncbi:hypothetical protein [Methylobacterium planeticum]|uniref:hypothetical protein n=1 Tax=Methylobacterium planeticum TaxID=2615211 RepID=UPI00177D7243|nr:hypothetical protein [Methylobacterium planeticum]